jgi:hypothetical protein
MSQPLFHIPGEFSGDSNPETIVTAQEVRSQEPGIRMKEPAKKIEEWVVLRKARARIS